ncbi:hypothetical protein [Escherichia albertii]|uniref:hypothetical protein n=1 Tax=Escherichia albertii TaxID=208962 RepID=UPI0007442375|nr:hypothetical protein [Escherichia albertii]EFO1267986.1 hypothetical protein [Escherichia albertii]MCZ8805926.1 hypothetical protein [Escherichia albertii]MCZ8965533.1 hypothetical protein [Escherichia albertii]MCZ9057130.1 hypothetical protein [Escherichia albertii]
MRLFFILSLVLGSASCYAAPQTLSDYFKQFSAAFAGSSSSAEDYDALISLGDNAKIDPQSCFFDRDSAQTWNYYPRAASLKALLSQKAYALFSGKEGRDHFLRYLHDSGLLKATDMDMTLAKKEYQKGAVTYSYMVSEWTENYSYIQIIENTMTVIPVPGEEDAFSENSIMFSFTRQADGKIKLSKINCAG